MPSFVYLSMTIMALTVFYFSNGQEGAQYLKSAIKDLRNINSRQSVKRIDPGMVLATITSESSYSSTSPTAERRIQNTNQNGGIPPLSLTKEQLAALYQKAVTKGDTVSIKNSDDSYIRAAVHEIDDSSDHKTDGSKGEGDASGGYYYYYYPIKSFLDEMTSQTAAPDKYAASASSHQDDYHHHHDLNHDVDKSHYQYHSHTHQHNVKITKDDPQEKKGRKALEPLFMAISGFIGMAVMFALSVLVFPKFGTKKSHGTFKKNEQHISDIARVALQAIEGRDCSERFACELEKTARTFNVQDNRFVKLLKRMTPLTAAKHASNQLHPKRLKCTAIPCKKKANNKVQPKVVAPKKKPNATSTRQKKKKNTNTKKQHQIRTPK